MTVPPPDDPEVPPDETPRPLGLQDRTLFQRYFSAAAEVPELSVYSFSHLLIWTTLFTIDWLICEQCLCVFFHDAAGCFLYVPPVGGRLSRTAVEACFRRMDRLNANPAWSRIENAAAPHRSWFLTQGFSVREKPLEYVYSRSSLAGLRGTGLKSRRNCCNQFYRAHRRWRARRYEESDCAVCREVLQRWQKHRRERCVSDEERLLLEDTVRVQAAVLTHAALWEVSGCVLEADGAVVGYSFGYPVGTEIFCIMFEVCDPAVRGAPAVIFREWCRSLEPYRLINAMDDSGIVSLRRVKELYRPCRRVGNYQITRRGV